MPPVFAGDVWCKHDVDTWLEVIQEDGWHVDGVLW